MTITLHLEFYEFWDHARFDTILKYNNINFLGSLFSKITHLTNKKVNSRFFTSTSSNELSSSSPRDCRQIMIFCPKTCWNNIWNSFTFHRDSQNVLEKRRTEIQNRFILKPFTDNDVIWIYTIERILLNWLRQFDVRIFTMRWPYKIYGKNSKSDHDLFIVAKLSRKCYFIFILKDTPTLTSFLKL